jgi:hypothetical protein
VEVFDPASTRVEDILCGMRTCGGNGGKALHFQYLGNRKKYYGPGILQYLFQPLSTVTAVGKYCGIGHVEHKFLEYCRYSRFEK